MAELFRGATGAAAALDPKEVLAGRPLRYASGEGGQEFRTPSDRLEFYSEQLAEAGLAPMPDWQPDPQEERDRARWPLRLLTAPGYFQAIPPMPGSISCAGARARPIASCTPTRRPGAASSMARGCVCSMRAVRSALCSGSATRCCPVWCWCPASGRMAKHSPARSTCCARTAIPISATAPPTRAPSSTWRPGLKTRAHAKPKSASRRKPGSTVRPLVPRMSGSRPSLGRRV
jgi:hypothetical protein